MKKLAQLLIVLSVGSILLVASSCKKKNKEEETPTTPEEAKKSYVLQIDNGARSMSVGKSITYTAKLVKTDGTVISSPSGVVWTSSSTAAGSFSGSIFTAASGENTTVQAKVTYEGKEYTASVPLAISIENTSLFGVVPAAIIWSTNSGTIPLNTVYFGTSTTSYTFSSNNTGVANVSTTGEVSFVAPGNATITVTATIGGQTSTVLVPVLVVGTPEVKLPVARVVVTPQNVELFKNETQQYTAKAYDSDGNDVTSTVSFTWSATPKDAEEPMPITLNASGLATAKNLGDAYVTATAAGINGTAEVTVNPDTIILIDPFMVELGGFNTFTLQPNPDNATLTSKTYKVDRAAYKAGQTNYLNLIANPTNLTWMLPLTGVAMVDSFYDIVSFSNTSINSTLITKKPGKFGASVVIAHSPGSDILPGLTAVTVNP